MDVTFAESAVEVARRKTHVLGVLMLLHGVAEALFLAAVFVLVWGVQPPDLWAASLVIGLGIGLGGALAFAGLRVLECRNRMLAFNLLALNVFMVFTAWCAPSAVALTLYGVFVLTRDEVVAGFATGPRFE